VSAGNPAVLERIVISRIGPVKEFSRSFLKINDKFKRPIGSHVFSVIIGRQIDIVPAEIHILVKGRSGDMPINTHVTPYH
jgi:hypothetical protein